MSAVLPLCALALRPVLGAVLRSIGLADAADSISDAVALLTERFTDQSRRLPEALDRAGERAWRCLEIAFAGESLWTILDRAEDRAFRDQVRALLQTEDFPKIKEDFRRRCLTELRAARKAGCLSARRVSTADLARQTAAFARFAQPTALIDAEWQALAAMGAALHQAGYPMLGKLVAVRLAPSANASLLAVAMRYFFRREVEGDAELFRELSLERLDQLNHAQEAGFAALADANEAQLKRLDDLLDILGDIRGGVLDIRAEQERQGRKLDDFAARVLQALATLQLDGRPLRSSDSLSIRGDGERRLVKQLLAEYRALPEEQKRASPALLNGLGKLQVATGDYQNAQEAFTRVAEISPDAKSRAEGHYNAYHAALERAAIESASYQVALAELKMALRFDPPRFAPFPLEDYEPLRILGAGGFGVTFLCKKRLTGTMVAVKALQADGLERDVASVLQEASTLDQLAHPAIIRLRHCGYADPLAQARPFLEMDYFDSMTLEEHVRTNGPLTVGNMLALFRMVAEALHAAHGKGILHRDVKPANLLVRRPEGRWEIRVIDFGLALKQSLLGQSPTGARANRSMTGAEIAGTRHYAAPEQMGELPGARVGTWSDVYGWARTCCYALFQNAEPTYLNYKKIPDALGVLLGQCLARQPIDRPSDFSQVLDKLVKILPDPPKSQPQKPLPPPPPQQPRAVVKPAPAPGLTPTVLPLTADEEEKIAWRTAERNGTAESYERYLERHSNGRHAEEARHHAARLLRVVLLKDMDNVPLRKRYLATRTPAECEADCQRMPAFLKQRQGSCLESCFTVLLLLTIIAVGVVVVFVALAVAGLVDPRAVVALYDSLSAHPDQLLAALGGPEGVVALSAVVGAVMLVVILLAVALRARSGSHPRSFAALGPLPRDAYRLSVASARRRYLGE